MLHRSAITGSRDELMVNSKCKQHILTNPCCKRTQKSSTQQNGPSQENITTIVLQWKHVKQKELRPVENLED